jgi:hypothetical protein
MHVGSRQTAEEIIGNVVVECYDFDEVNIFLFFDEKGEKAC